MKLLQLHVFRNAALGDCTSGGVSSKVGNIYMVDERGREMATMPPVECIFRAEDCGGGYKALIPVVKPVEMVGPMFGGNLASALYGAGGAEVYRIHDRFETRESYRATTQD